MIEDNVSYCLERFITAIAEEEGSPQAIERGALSISDDLNIGRIIVSVDIPAGPTDENEHHETMKLFTSEDGFDKTENCEILHETKESGKVSVTACALPGRTFDGVRSTVTAVLELVYMHFSRYMLGRRVEKSAMTQMLTGLPNTGGYLRKVGEKYVMGTIAMYDAYYFNLKGFGLVNKRFGQREGNEILIRYVTAMREFFKEDELFGHLGGDNFVALVQKGERSMEFQKLLQGIKTYGVHDGMQIPLTIQAVAGVMPIEMPCPVDRVIGGPAVAIAYAKRTKQPLVYLTEQLNDEVNRAKSIEQGFHKALKNKEFTVFYQPKVNSVTGEIIGCEALTRWFENGRMVPPAAFIPVLEQAGQITELDLAMLELVCQDIAGWKEGGHKAVPASVNFSRRDLAHPELADQILGIINRYGIQKDEIIIEVTETTSEEEQASMASFLNSLKEYGIETSIDDFGTGYSSLSVLREFPVGEIKIDRSFINHSLEGSDEIIIKSIIDMAEQLSIDVITEGVECVDQKDFLHRLGCDRIQGFLYDKPLPKDQFEKRLLSGNYEIK